LLSDLRLSAPRCSWSRVPAAIRSVLAVVAIIATLAGPAGAAQPYEDAVRGKPLVEGLGFEGVLTVFDQTPRMFRTLGQPLQRAQFALWYFYEGGELELVVRAEYHDGKYLVRSIRATGRPGAVVSGKGIKLGDPASRVIAVHGPPESRPAGKLVYAARGAIFYIGKANMVIGIEVSRPGLSPDKEAQPEVTPPVGTPNEVPVERVPTMADLGIAVPTPGSWVQAGEPTLDVQEMMGDGGAIRLRVEACRDCASKLGDRITRLETTRTTNEVPAALRDVDRAWLERLGAEAGYVGRYEDGSIREWLVALRRGRRAWIVTLRLDLSKPVSQAVLVDVSKALNGIRLLEGAP
jgi:hypothetical protein